MPKTIWKFDLPLKGGPQSFAIPGNRAKPLLFAEQHGELRMWWEVYPDAPSGPDRIVQIVGTGDSIVPHWQHIGSVIQGAYVWHLYLVQ